jgi:hypothetical protein
LPPDLPPENVLTLILLGNLAEREGFIPAPEELVSKGLFELSEYPYLRKYLETKRRFGPHSAVFLARQLTIDHSYDSRRHRRIALFIRRRPAT